MLALGRARPSAGTGASAGKPGAGQPGGHQRPGRISGAQTSLPVTASGSRRRARSRIRRLLARIPTFGCASGVGDYFAGIEGLALSPTRRRGTPCAGVCARRRASRSTSSRITGCRCCSATWRTLAGRISCAPPSRLAREDAKGGTAEDAAPLFLAGFCDLHPCTEALFIHPTPCATG